MKTKTFRGGIHPLRKIHHGKPATQHLSIEIMPPPKIIVIPMTQGYGTTCDPLIKRGDRVLFGQKIGEPRGYVGAPVHASVSGTVLAIEQREVLGGIFCQCAIIENDGLDEPAELSEKLTLESEPERLAAAVREAGIVGMGGAAFPTQIKLTPPKGRVVDTIIVNGAECEPYLTCDHRVMLEYADDLIMGVRLAMRTTGAKRGVIGIENNKPDAIERLAQAAHGTDVTVVPLKVKYPQGSEKHLIKAATGRQVPSGRLPADAGCVVINAATAVAIGQCLPGGKALTARVITVTGAVERPANLYVRVGTPIGDILRHCGGQSPGAIRLVSGGPMMGAAIYDIESPAVKNTSGVLSLDKQMMRRERSTACIRCARCAGACPMRLMPMELRAASERSDYHKAEALHVLDCIECGSCTYSCPAKLDVLTRIRVCKRIIIANRKRT